MRCTFWAVFALALLADQLSKEVVFALLSEELSSGARELWPGYFALTLQRNTGSAFGIFSGRNLELTVISCLLIALLLYFHFRKRPEQDPGRKRLQALALALILAGAGGNLIDRMLYDSVRDFLDFKVWPIFNLADSFITIGVGLYLLEGWLKCPRGAGQAPLDPVGR